VRRLVRPRRLLPLAVAAPALALLAAGLLLRARGDDVPAVVAPDGDRVRVEFRSPQRAIAPGQSVVLYRGDELLGGARILESIR